LGDAQPISPSRICLRYLGRGYKQVQLCLPGLPCRTLFEVKLAHSPRRITGGVVF
jgi:hypothetical protein